MNDLALKDDSGNLLNLSEDGEGLFKEYLQGKYVEAAQQALDNGIDLGNQAWLTISGGRVIYADLGLYARTVKRIKGTPAFDAFDLGTGENQEFGSPVTDKRHFTWYSLQQSGALPLPKQAEEKAEDERFALASRGNGWSCAKRRSPGKKPRKPCPWHSIWRTAKLSGC